MLQISKGTDERLDARAADRQGAGALECWCLHGAMGSAVDWRPTAVALAKRGISTRALDLWRYFEGGSCALEEFGSALNAELAAESARGAGRVLIGYSMGGRLALHGLLADDSPWDAAVIISAHPGLEDPAEVTARRAADATWAARAFAGSWPEFLQEWSAQPVLAGSQPPHGPEEDLRLAAKRGAISRSFLDWSLAAQQPLWERLPELAIPVLWLAGGLDRKFSALAERAAAQIPGGRVKIAPTAGHRLPWDAPDWFQAELAAFLEAPAAV